MKLGKRLCALATVAAAAVALAVPAHADVDTDFANQLHGYGVYGQRDYNAWLAKIACERLGNELDTNAEKQVVTIIRCGGYELVARDFVAACDRNWGRADPGRSARLPADLLRAVHD